MGNVSIQKKEYQGWKNCIEISNGTIDTIITTDVGPRIIRFGFVGKENAFCEVKDQLGITSGDKWNVIGGHRLWHSPEVPARTWYPDNDKVEWKKRKNGITLKPPVEVWTQIEKGIDFTMSPDEAKVTVQHRLTNRGAWDIELSVWAITVMAAGGKAIIPQVTKDTGMFPNRTVAFWKFTKMNDKRLYFGEKYITVDYDPKASPLKIGVPSDIGWAAYAGKDSLFVKRFDVYEDAEFPDLGSAVQSYTCDFMTELESVSPIVLLSPGKTVVHTETWQLFENSEIPQTEEEIDKLVLPLIK